MGGAASLIGEGAKVLVGQSGSQQQAQYSAMGEQRGQDIQLAMYRRNMAESAPWRATGQAALAELASIYGLPSFGGGGVTYDQSGNVISYGRNKTGFEKMEDQIGMDKLKKTHGPAAALIAPDPLTAYGTAKFKGFPMISEVTDPGIEFGPVDVGSPLSVDYRPYSGSEAAYQKFTQLPQYQFQLQEAEKAANRAAAARGTYGGGAQMRSLMEIAQGNASQGFNDYVQGLRNLAGLGGEFTSQSQTMGQALGQNLAQSSANMGYGAAQSAANQTNLLGQGIAGVSQWFGQQQGNQQAPQQGSGYIPYTSGANMGYGSFAGYA